MPGLYEQLLYCLLWRMTFPRYWLFFNHRPDNWPLGNKNIGPRDWLPLRNPTNYRKWTRWQRKTERNETTGHGNVWLMIRGFCARSREKVWGSKCRVSERVRRSVSYCKSNRDGSKSQWMNNSSKQQLTVVVVEANVAGYCCCYCWCSIDARVLFIELDIETSSPPSFIRSPGPA